MPLAAANRRRGCGSESPSRHPTSPGGCAGRSGSPSVTASSSAASRTAVPRRGRDPGRRPHRRDRWPGRDRPRQLLEALATLEFPFEVRLVRGNDERTVQVGGERPRPARPRACSPRPEADVEPADADDDEALDAYSSPYRRSAERLIPSVASLRVTRQAAGGRAAPGRRSPSSRSGTSSPRPTSSPARTGGTATFVDGAELEFVVVGRDPLSDLAVVRATAGLPPRPDSATPPGCASVSSSLRSAIRSVSPGR